MKTIFQKYGNWCSRWSFSQLVFVAIIVLLLGSCAILAVKRLDQAREIIRNLSTQQTTQK